VSIAAETAETTISNTASSERKTIFFLEDLGLDVNIVASEWEGDEPPGSDSPNLPYSIVCVFFFVVFFVMSEREKMV
jgi:hypothetical protein